MILHSYPKFYSKKLAFVSAFALGLALQPLPVMAMEHPLGNEYNQAQNDPSEIINSSYEKFDVGDLQEASATLFREEGEKGNPKAKILAFYDILWGHDPDTTEWPAIQEWLTNQGDDPIALHWLGMFEEKEWEGHPVNLEAAERYYLTAAEKGFGKGYSSIADLHRFGLNSQPIDIEKALEYYLLAAQHGDPSSLRDLGHLYQYGWEGHPPDMEMAEKYFLEVDAYSDIASMYYHGPDAQPLDPEKAIKYYLLAAKQGDYAAYTMAGSLYEKGWEGHPADPAAAAECYLLAIEHGITYVYHNLGDLYRNGPDGQPLDPQKAIEYYLLAAKKNKDYAAYDDIAILYEKGWNGRPADVETAEKYYLKGGKKNDLGYWRLAIKYDNGIDGFSKDLKKAAMYYSKLLDNPNLAQYAYFPLGTLYETGWDDQPRNLEKAVHYYTKNLEHIIKNNAEETLKENAEKTLKKLLFPEASSEGTVEEPPHCILSLEREEAEKQYFNAATWFEPLAGKMGWKYGEYLNEVSIKTNNRKVCKPEGQEHYNNFSKTLINASVLLPKAFEEGSFVFITPKASIKEHLLKSFKVYDPLEQPPSDEVGVRLYNMCGGTVIAFGNDNVKRGDQVMDLLEGKYSLSALINHHQKKKGLLEKLRANKEDLLERLWGKNEKNAVLDEESLKLDYSLLAKPNRQYVWGGGKPTCLPADCLANTLEKTYSIHKNTTKICLSKMSKGEKTPPLLELRIKCELQRDELQLQILAHLDEKIAKRVGKIELLKGIVDSFQEMVTATQPKKVARFKEDYDCLSDKFD